MKFYFLLIIICFSTTIKAQFETNITTSQLDAILFKEDQQLSQPGQAIIIIKDDSIAYFNAKGLANIKQSKPIELQTQFNIGSVTKMFTATAILLLEESGKLNRNEDIRKYIPEVPITESVITINNLLSHTAGIRTHFELALFLFNYKTKLAYFPQMINYINDYNELSFETGENFAYSNTGYMLLAMIIEKVSGETYSEYITKNIFIPLGMHNTYVSSGKVKYLNDGTASYRIKENGKTKKPYFYIDAIGATGINSTLYDLFLWDKNFYNNKLGKGSTKLIDALTTSFTLSNGSSVHYGCGVILKKYRLKSVVEHSGGWGEYLFQYRRFPDEHISILAWNNGSNYSPFVAVDEISNALFNFGDDAHQNIDIRPAFNQTSLTGTYITANNYIREVKLINDTLVLQLPLNQSSRRHPLLFTGPVNDSIIQYIDTAGNIIKFKKNGSTITGFSWAGGEYFVAERYYEKINETVTIEPKMFSGKYYLENHKNKIKITFNKRKQSYYLSQYPFYHFKMEHVTGNIFHLEHYDYYIRVEENSLIMGDDWIFNLHFIKQ